MSHTIRNEKTENRPDPRADRRARMAIDDINEQIADALAAAPAHVPPTLTVLDGGAVPSYETLGAVA